MTRLPPSSLLLLALLWVASISEVVSMRRQPKAVLAASTLPLPTSTRFLNNNKQQTSPTAAGSAILSPGSFSLSIYQRLVAGGSSRAVAQLLLYPVDALRTLAQTRDHRTLADVGARALVRGCATTSSFAVFIGGIQFGIFGATRELCGPVLAAAAGAAGSCVVSVPQEVIKQRLVTGVYSSFRQAFTTIYQTEGVRGFYSAWRPTMARNIPFVVVTFTANDWMKQRLVKDRESKELSVGENLVVGISSALLGAFITHPADVVKTRMMTQAASAALPYTSSMDCVRTILKMEGVASFYAGFVQRSSYMGPLWAIQFALNGRVCQSLELRNRAAAEAKQVV